MGRAYLKLAGEGKSDAQFDLGHFYRNGIGNTKDEWNWNHKGEEKAFKWYLKSAEGGKWYLKSAEGGNLIGQYNVGCCYQNRFGTIKNEYKALQWYSKSAEVMHNSLLEFVMKKGFKVQKMKRKHSSSDFLKELIANFQCRNKYVLPILGITQDSMTKEGLKFIHRKDLSSSQIRRSRLANETPSSRAYGVLPYIEPEVFNNHLCTQASDIYSFGIIMWIISTGKVPFSDRAYNLDLILEIINGLRPKIDKGTPQCYIELMKNCWHMNVQVLKRFIIKTEDSLMFLNAEQKMHEDVEEYLTPT
ncbi:hypothetical protein Glove_313g51 [Diversispora epigaea]|uniref:Serine-threonine/tyrosine-protein kinase catalytic domain-containing protein n=1 Tax=Diversispora epigaea TaxID=1348612 RepID=A0A397HWY5_9GLOM|nr:hypothetical protein Glove_313g51 [Diversispora epigaea]